MPKYAYYNEHDPNAAQWLRELIKLDRIAPGVVDERSIVDVDPNELKSFSQIHLFCGVAVWSFALRQAGWGDDREILTGSCPCQSFSAAGKQRGFDDERHLWPHMFRIARELRPRTIIGEQVASSGALAWWDLVASDLESEDYAATAIDLSGASIGAPHIRSRLFWVAHKLVNSSQSQCQSQCESKLPESQQYGVTSTGVINIMADSVCERSQWGRIGISSDDVNPEYQTSERCVSGIETQGLRDVNELAHTNGEQPEGSITSIGSQRNQAIGNHPATRDSSPSTFWDDCDWLPCRDGKYRATKSGISPLVNGTTTGVGHSSDPSIESVENTQEARVMRLKGYGNAIVAPLAIEFIQAVMEIL